MHTTEQGSSMSFLGKYKKVRIYDYQPCNLTLVGEKQKQEGDGGRNRW